METVNKQVKEEIKRETQQEDSHKADSHTEDVEGGLQSKEKKKGPKKGVKKRSRSPSPIPLSKSHCTCCHVCHVSMKQRPRPVLACSTCNIIICKTCLEEKWPTNQWIENAGKDWACHKCKGTCNCKACKGKKAKPKDLGAPNFVLFNGAESLELFQEFTKEPEGEQISDRLRKRKQKENHSASSASSDEELSEEEGEHKKAKTRTEEALEQIQSHKEERNQSISLNGLGSNVFNACSSDETKLSGLLQRRQRCLEVIGQMNQLLNLANNEHSLINEEITRLSNHKQTQEPSRPSFPSIEEFPKDGRRSSLVRVEDFPLL